MPLAPGTQLGSYQIITLIGAGGMGEVYKAKDAKLNRWVAIKVLPASLASDAALLARFDREAKAVAALSHPNVLGIHDLATQDGLTYAVMELLEGESLRDRLKGGALPPKRAIEIATELAQGLGAAHEQGIVHRDVKPENIFITGDGRVKVLDFGLAKWATDAKGAAALLETEALSRTPDGTGAGVVLGTAGYMSPEQVKGEPADHRADIFSFGVVLYEMLSGQRPFKGATAHHTMTAILDQDPPALVGGRGPLPPALERLVAHCLEKNPRARFQSMQDITYDLQNLSSASTGPKVAAVRHPGRARLLAAGLPVAVLLVLLGLLALAGRLHLGRPMHVPTFVRIGHRPGTVETACFGPDASTVYFSERLQGGPPELFVLPSNATEPRPLGVQDALLLGVSPENELAILRHPRAFFGRELWGMLAHVSGSGGSPRDVQNGVLEAAWDGAGHATLSFDEKSVVTLEFPAGKPLASSFAGSRTMAHLKLSKGRDRIALVDSDESNKSEIVTYDRSGRRKVLFTKVGDARGDSFTGLAWGPEGELWVSEVIGDQTDLWALTLEGQRRLLWRAEGRKSLMDVSPEGRMLLVDQQARRGVVVHKADGRPDQDVSQGWGTQSMGLSGDGKALLLIESENLDGGAHQDRVYLDRLDGQPALKIANGTGETLSSDGEWVNLWFSGFTSEELDPSILGAMRQAGLDPKAALDAQMHRASLVFVSTGSNRPFALALPSSLSDAGKACLHPDGKRVIFNGSEKDQAYWFVVDRQGGRPRILTKPGYGTVWASLEPLSPEGERLIVAGPAGPFSIQALAGGDPVPIKGLKDWDRPIGWCSDGKSIFIRNDPRAMPVVISRVALDTGARQDLYRYAPGDTSGLIAIRNPRMSWDGKVIAFTYLRQLSQLYRVDGLR